MWQMCCVFLVVHVLISFHPLLQCVCLYCLNLSHRFHKPFLYSIMSPLQLLVALSGLSVTIVTGQYSYYDFADPPPLPAKGTFLLACMHKQSFTLFSCVPISWYKKHIPGMYTFLYSCHTLAYCT